MNYQEIREKVEEVRKIHRYRTENDSYYFANKALANSLGLDVAYVDGLKAAYINKSTICLTRHGGVFDSNFELAHTIGHFVLGHDVSSDSHKNNDNIETEANTFALLLMMPVSEFVPLAKSIDYDTMILSGRYSIPRRWIDKWLKSCGIKETHEYVVTMRKVKKLLRKEVEPETEFEKWALKASTCTVDDSDLSSLTKEELEEEVLKLRNVIREHRDANSNDLCWLNDIDLYARLPEGRPEREYEIPPMAEFISNCCKYREEVEKRKV